MLTMTVDICIFKYIYKHLIYLKNLKNY